MSSRVASVSGVTRSKDAARGDCVEVIDPAAIAAFDAALQPSPHQVGSQHSGFITIMASPSTDPSTANGVPPNLLLNPRAHVLRSSEAPLATVPSTNTTTSTSTNTDPPPPEEEQSLLAQALAHKATGNEHFTSTPPDYETAISYYRSALEVCPSSLVDHLTILHANIAAGFIKLQKWKEAEDAATESLKVSGEDDEILRAREARKRAKEQKEKKEQKAKVVEDGGKGKAADPVDTSEGRIEELDDDDAEDVAKVEWGKNWKARLRRAKAREMQNTWQSLSGALEDRKAIQQALTRIPPNLEEKKQKEVAEMMGKLKGLGDTILKPFGLSTNNFQMVKDEKSGGYSLNFSQDGGK
ncbi:hypothetical protein Dda_6306 [Drechslerella dactyloides]|uniref:Tetratricopeptide repeat protein 1 n=1 Tax=Drechslerella dactyloides TaxID=74499 RepID=A0AAD6NIF7_DREDA|nr:hypothetical protein Dda_6306 [Drechslerella dactyloides]